MSDSPEHSTATSRPSAFAETPGLLDADLTHALRRAVEEFATLRHGALRAMAQGGGLPGRATGGAVSPGQAYLVGENGPEVFVPTSAGSVASNQALNARNQTVSVAINVAAPTGGDTARSMQRSSRQVASAVRRALNQS